MLLEKAFWVRICPIARAERSVFIASPHLSVFLSGCYSCLSLPHQTVQAVTSAHLSSVTLSEGPFSCSSIALPSLRTAGSSSNGTLSSLDKDVPSVRRGEYDYWLIIVIGSKLPA